QNFACFEIHFKLGQTFFFCCFLFLLSTFLLSSSFFLLTFHKAFLLVQFIPRSKSLSSSFDKISNIVQIPRRHQINSQKNKQATNQEGSNIGKKKGNGHVK